MSRSAISGTKTRKEGLNLLPLSEDIRREQRSGGGCRATSSRVPADPNVGEWEGGGLTDSRSTRKADGSRVRMCRKVRQYPQSTKEIVQYQRAVPPGTTTLSIEQD